ncbi:hypothetical protein ADUPG1_006048 [Aduncisulcus paluster]|uniref:Uncharacterized protein n=1 Tax=Aduncisulcus paluster TaxID=2918883 RepID=A0ABQ5KGK1_9EUKA|nr:hypothetical protein ADUPG1_006048 [Aduncisulcus paluster]
MKPNFSLICAILFIVAALRFGACSNVSTDANVDSEAGVRLIIRKSMFDYYLPLFASDFEYTFPSFGIEVQSDVGVFSLEYAGINPISIESTPVISFEEPNIIDISFENLEFSCTMQYHMDTFPYSQGDLDINVQRGLSDVSIVLEADHDDPEQLYAEISDVIVGAYDFELDWHNTELNEWSDGKYQEVENSLCDLINQWTIYAVTRILNNFLDSLPGTYVAFDTYVDVDDGLVD